ncbi:MAG: FHA domain-containing protein [Planctomycetes bacterium]|nr:FHA domain-containing protein [Planctomycetota bacterium]
MKLSLVVSTPGKQEGKVLPIGLQQFLIGRDPQCHLRPASAAISKRHCALIQRDGKIFVRDFDSTNGTFVNDQPIKGEVEVHHDDRLRVGPLLFIVQVEASAPVNKPTPPPPTKKPATAPAKAPAGQARPAEAGKAPADKTPVPDPAKGAAAAAAGGSADEDIAAMLLSLKDDDNPSTNLGSGEIPEGSTVMEMTVPPEMGADGKPKEEEKPKPAGSANTSSAAKAILEKYMRRPR